MALNFLLKRSGTASKRPDPGSMALGELDLNYNAETGGVYYKDSNGDIAKVGSAQVSATAPNSSPAGSAGNSLGEFWLDTTSGTLYIWDGSAWADTAATAISDSSFTAAGEILVGTGASAYTALSVGTDGQILLADSACTEGVKWVTCGGISLLGTTCGSGEAPYTTAFGFQAGDSALSTGFYNVSVGYQAGTNVTSGDYNVALGSFANSGNGSNNTAVGHNAYGNTTSTGLNNVAVGYQALDASTSSSNNTAVGSQSLGAVTIGNNNTAVGFNAGTLLTSGPRNTLVGYRAGALLTTGVENTIVGAFEGTGPLSCNVVLANGNGDVRFQANNAGAWSPNGSSYGISGQFLQSAGTGAAPTWSTLPAATTTTAGIVQLNDTTSSTSTTEALTANQGKELQDQINALAVSSNITLAGTIDASTGNLVTVTAEGTTAGFTVGSPLPTAAAGNDNYFVIVTVPGTMTPPGGSAQECHQGDWFLSDGSAWVFLDVGFNATAATTSTPGVVQLATDAEVQAGVNTDHAVTPSGLQSKVSDSVSTASSTTLASSQAVKDAYDLATSAQGTADLALPLAGGTMTGDIVFNAGQTFAGTVSEQDFQAKGDLVSGYGVNTFGVVSVGSDGQVLSANSACASGLEWITASGGGGSPATPTVQGTLYGCSEAAGNENTSVGYNSLFAITSGNYNVGLGAQTLRSTTTGSLNTALGGYAMCSNVGGGSNVAVGLNSLRANTSGSQNTGLGFGAMFCNTTGTLNTGLGSRALYFLVSGDCNTLVGACTGGGFSLGSKNVIIGAGVDIPVNNASCQLAIGYGLNSYWLTGCSTGAIRPGAGIVDCAGSCGTAGQVLSSNGTNAVEWITPSGSGTVTDITAGAGLTGGTITTSGTIALDATCVIAPSAFTAKGDILAASAASTPTALPVGANGQLLAANSACTEGLAWVNNPTTALSTSSVSGVSELLPAAGDALCGGYFAGSINDEGTCYALIIAPKNVGQIYSGNGAQQAWLPTSISRSTTNGALITECFRSGVLTNGSFLFQTAFNLNACGYSDWYVPARCEMLQVVQNLGRVWATNPIFRSGGSQVMDCNSYSTATESSTTSVWTQSSVSCGLTTGQQLKSNGSDVRLIRREPISAVSSGTALTFPDTQGFDSLGVGCTVTQPSTGATGTITNIDTGTCTITFGSVTGAFNTGSSLTVSNGFVPNPVATPVDGQILTASSASSGGTSWASALPQVAAPSASTDAGNEGEIASDASYFYMYTGGRWQRTGWDGTAW